MDINFNYVSSDQLGNLFKKADRDLTDALLNGASWDEIKDKRIILTELAIALHRREKPEDFGDSPAENPVRKH